jgi:hypothetical protein
MPRKIFGSPLNKGDEYSFTAADPTCPVTRGSTRPPALALATVGDGCTRAAASWPKFPNVFSSLMSRIGSQRSAQAWTMYTAYADSHVSRRDQPGSTSGAARGRRPCLRARWIASPDGLRMVWEQGS